MQLRSAGRLVAAPHLLLRRRRRRRVSPRQSVQAGCRDERAGGRGGAAGTGPAADPRPGRSLQQPPAHQETVSGASFAPGVRGQVPTGLSALMGEGGTSLVGKIRGGKAPMALSVNLRRWLPSQSYWLPWTCSVLLCALPRRSPSSGVLYAIIDLGIMFMALMEYDVRLTGTHLSDSAYIL